MSTILGLVFIGFVCYLFRDSLIAMAKGTAAILGIIVCAYIALHTPVVQASIADAWTTLQSMMPDFSGIGANVAP